MSFLEVMGVSCGRNGKDSPLVELLAAKLGNTKICKGCENKAEALWDFADKRRLNLAELCIVCDDINEVPALQIDGLSVAPSTAHGSENDAANQVLTLLGGAGAMRELIEMLLTSR